MGMEDPLKYRKLPLEEIEEHYDNIETSLCEIFEKYGITWDNTYIHNAVWEAIGDLCRMEIERDLAQKQGMYYRMALAYLKEED
jgi:hypothetical protein